MFKINVILKNSVDIYSIWTIMYNTWKSCFGTLELAEKQWLRLRLTYRPLIYLVMWDFKLRLLMKTGALEKYSFCKNACWSNCFRAAFFLGGTGGGTKQMTHWWLQFSFLTSGGKHERCNIFLHTLHITVWGLRPLKIPLQVKQLVRTISMEAIATNSHDQFRFANVHHTDYKKKMLSS